ncbi:hypothetical protein DRU65_02740 [Salmonella enterica subsp. enterica]|nr:hypothetical protein [Salmonella enterica subsp. enterica serovar Chester]ECG1252594.1 hypothetical protein [Salmonella enterica subsp. enterica]
MFGVFRERSRLRHQVKVLELELEIARTELSASKEVWEENLRAALQRQREYCLQLSDLHRKHDAVVSELHEARRDADTREKMLGWNLGALIYFLEKRWEPDTLLKLLYEKLSLPGRRSAAIEYFRSHGYEVKDE